ncbi:MAG: site-specific integrase [Pirellulales bacterium]|nr:site-specific integrase [Pirellulales bacterium]
MASIFKRSKKKGEPYSIQYLDHRNKRRTAKGFTDKGLTEELAAKLEADARLRRTGLVDASLDRVNSHRAIPIAEQLDEFEQSLSNNSRQYVRLTMGQVRRIVDGCGIKMLADIDAEAVQKYLRTRSKAKSTGHRTYNQYLQAFGTFCNWCLTTGRLLANPMLGVARLNQAVDVRHARRALSAEEVASLIASARSSGISIQRFSGEQRARIYLMAYLTGLRRRELGSLTAKSFNLNAEPPTLTVKATASKHRREDVLPLHPELAAMLSDWLKSLQPGAKLFPRIEQRKTHVMVRKDLERAGIPYETEDGIADFHASGRHTYITELLRNGASLPEAKELARHSDIKTTMRYTHIGLQDQAKAIAALRLVRMGDPVATDLPRAAPKPKPALQMRCISGGSEGHSLASTGNGQSNDKRRNSRGSKSFGVVCPSLATNAEIGATGFEPATS